MGIIAGFCNFSGVDFRDEKWRNCLGQMKTVLEHRRPQTNKTTSMYRDGCIALDCGFSSFEYAIGLDGEIYNEDELTRELALKGYKVNSLPELVLSGFIEYGTEIASMLNGVFAFVIYDKNKRKLYLFRDRFGVKPLFYTFVEKTIVFASEIKALLKYPGVKAQIDEEGLCELFGVGPARTSGLGVFRNIFEIRHGYFNIFRPRTFNEERFFEFVSQPHTESYEETVEHASFLLKDAVKRQMRADAPICTMLSGGLDSGIVTAYCAKEQENPIYTYSFDFIDNDKNFKQNSFQPELDRPYAIKTSEYLKTKHEFLYCGYEELADSLYGSVLAKDLPGMADIDSSLMHFCAKIKEKHTVTLTGECSDEIFGGYPWFRSEKAFNTNAFPWSPDLEFRKRLISKDMKIDLDGYVNMRYMDSLYSCPALSGESPEEARRREISYLTIKHFMTTLIDRLERAGAYSSLICRTPFSDYRLVEYLWNVPWSYKCRNGVVKGLLRDAAAGMLPKELLMRKKSPYPKTYDPLYEKLLIEKLNGVLNDSNSPILPLIDVKSVKEFMSSPSDYGSPWFGQLMAAPQMLAYLLQINYWLKAYNVEILLQ